MRAQAVPLATYRRAVALAHARRQMVVFLAMGFSLCAVSPSLVSSEGAPQAARALTMVSLPAVGPSLLARATGADRDSGAIGSAVAFDGEGDTVEPDADGDSGGPLPLLVADARASTSHLDEAGLVNVLIALTYLDGIVIPPGERLVFDDVARTWDYREDPTYVMGRATSVRGFLNMRGGGVCTVSTALWRAALAAGLRTDRRQSHYGLLEPDDPGFDATNTLIIANDSSEAITVHVWLEEATVRARLLADGELARVAVVSEPRRIGNGRWLVEQEVTWTDGRQATNPFVSQYYW